MSHPLGTPSRFLSASLSHGEAVVSPVLGRLCSADGIRVLARVELGYIFGRTLISQGHKSQVGGAAVVSLACDWILHLDPHTDLH